jgi:hypothetical protein
LSNRTNKKGKDNKVARWYVEMRIDFSGEIEADTKEEAENLAWTSWGDTMDSAITYEGVYSIDLEEMDEDEEEFPDEDEDGEDD